MRDRYLLGFSQLLEENEVRFLIASQNYISFTFSLNSIECADFRVVKSKVDRS